MEMEHTLLLLETLMVLNQQLKFKDGKDGKTATITTTETQMESHTITVTIQMDQLKKQC